MSGIRVAVVDSGIHADHPHIGGVSGGTAFDTHGMVTDGYADRLGHGTAVAAAIRDLSPSTSLLAVKVFDTVLTTSIHALAAGIRWATDEGACLINLSLGVENREHIDTMRSAIDSATQGGAIVVAAGAHDGVQWLPGTLPGVLRVELDWQYPRGQFGFTRTDDAVVFRTCGYPRPIPGVDPRRNLKGLSFAVANMTGVAAHVLSEHGTSHGRWTLDTLVKALEARVQPR